MRTLTNHQYDDQNEGLALRRSFKKVMEVSYDIRCGNIIVEPFSVIDRLGRVVRGVTGSNPDQPSSFQASHILCNHVRYTSTPQTPQSTSRYRTSWETAVSTTIRVM